MCIMAKVIYKRLSNEEAIKIYGKSMSFVGGNTHSELQRLGQSANKNNNDNKNPKAQKR